MFQFLRNIRDLMIRIIDWFYFPFLHFIPREVFRYAVTGGLNTILDLTLYFIFYRYILDMQVVELANTMKNHAKNFGCKNKSQIKISKYNFKGEVKEIE